MMFFKRKKFSALIPAVEHADSCEKLELLFIDHNLKEHGPDFLKLKNLKQLSIQAHPAIYDMPDFALPAEIGRLKKLTSLSILNLPLKHYPDWISTLTELEYLMLRGTDITTIPESISRLKKLKILRIENCPLEKLPSALSRMTGLKKLGLCDTRLTDLNAGLFPGNLRELNYSGTGCYDPSDLEKLRMALKKVKVFPR